MKKFLATLTALVLLLTACTFSAYAEDETWYDLLNVDITIQDYLPGMTNTVVTFTTADSVLLDIELDAERIAYVLMTQEQWKWDDGKMFIREDVLNEAIYLVKAYLRGVDDDKYLNQWFTVAELSELVNGVYRYPSYTTFTMEEENGEAIVEVFLVEDDYRANIVELDSTMWMVTKEGIVMVNGSVYLKIAANAGNL